MITEMESRRKFEILKDQLCFSGISVGEKKDVFENNRNNENNTRWISLDGKPERRCLCVPFYLCDAVDAVNVTYIQCSREDDICCLRPRVEKLESVMEINYCTCVSLNKCYFNDILMSYGIHIASFNQSSCAPSEVCCPNEYLLSTSSAAIENKSLTRFRGSQPMTTSFECNCVPVTFCNVSRNEFNAVRSAVCSSTEICCPFNNIIGNFNSNDIPLAKGCGLRKDTSVCSSSDGTLRNTNTTKTYFGEFPWMIMILKYVKNRGNEFICGGSLMSMKMVLTAAHCVKYIDKDSLLIRAGEYDSRITYDLEPFPHQERHVVKIRIHPFYLANVLFNDVAILVLDEPFEPAFNVAPVCVPGRLLNFGLTYANIYDKNRCIVAGWGKNEKGIRESVLKKVDVSIIDQENCEKKLRKTKLGERFRLHNSFICAEGQRNTDICAGYKGGPLFCSLRENSLQYVQVGIVSWDIECSDQYPGVYSNLYANSKWLTQEFILSSIFL